MLDIVGRDYSTFVNKRNHSPLMKKRPESRHPVGGRRSSELSRDPNLAVGARYGVTPIWRPWLAYRACQGGHYLA
jgi:hypothetical protein